MQQQNYIPNKSNFVFGNNQTSAALNSLNKSIEIQQFLTGSAVFAGSAFKAIPNLELFSCDSVERAWNENGHTYIANYAGGVYKLDAKGNVVAKNTYFSSPVAISVIQANIPKQGEWETEYGLVVIDSTRKAAYRLDTDLNIMFEIQGLINPIFVAASFGNGGFAIADRGHQKIIRFDMYGNHIAYVDFSAFSVPILDADEPTFSRENHIVSLKSAWGDADGSIYLLNSKSQLYLVSWGAKNRPDIKLEIDIFSTFVDYSDYTVSAMDIDYGHSLDPNSKRGKIYISLGKELDNDVYTVENEGYSSLVVLGYPNPQKEPKAILYGPYSGYGYPFIMKVSQQLGAASIFLITGEAKEDVSSSTSSSMSSVDPDTLWASTNNVSQLRQIETVEYEASNSDEYLVVGSGAIAYNNGKIYYISSDANKLYVYDIAEQTNTYIGTPSRTIKRLCLSIDGGTLWGSNEEYICSISKSNGTILSTTSVRGESFAPIGALGGMKINPIDGLLYLTDGQAIYKTTIASLALSNIALSKVANKPSITTDHLNDIVFTGDGAMYAIEKNGSGSRLFFVKYLAENITYDLVKTYTYEIDALTNSNL